MQDEERSPQYVSHSAHEALLAELESLPGDDRSGFFGPDSTTWRINRESAVFLGAGRAALLQLAHPWVAAALLQHSNLMNDAVGRFHSTFRVVYTMLFGTRAQAVAAARQVYQVHTGIRGEMRSVTSGCPLPTHYEANEVAALCWVFATLVESAILAHEIVLPKLSGAEREAYYLESKKMAALFGIPGNALPKDWAAFISYCEDMSSSSVLSVDAQARAMGQGVLSGVGTWIHPPEWYRALTAAWLTPKLREGFGFSFGAKEDENLRQAKRLLPLIYPRLPSGLRYVGPYHEAQARLRGKEPGMIIQKNNQFWMGIPRLLYPQLAGLE